jgi:hypothetical protein
LFERPRSFGLNHVAKALVDVQSISNAGSRVGLTVVVAGFHSKKNNNVQKPVHQL